MNKNISVEKISVIFRPPSTVVDPGNRTGPCIQLKNYYILSHKSQFYGQNVYLLRLAPPPQKKDVTILHTFIQIKFVLKANKTSKMCVEKHVKCYAKEILKNAKICFGCPPPRNKPKLITYQTKIVKFYSQSSVRPRIGCIIIPKIIQVINKNMFNVVHRCIIILYETADHQG